MQPNNVRLGPYASRIALLFLGVVLPLILFGIVAEEVLEKEPFSFDQPILTFVHAHATPFLDHLMYFATTAGSAIVLVPLNCLILAWLIKKGRRPDAAFWAVAVIGAAVIDFAAKNFFARVRPALWISRVHEVTFSFPSGHAMATMAAVAALCILCWPTRWRWFALLIGGAFVAIVGVSRVYFGVHYPSDVLAGWAASLAWVIGGKILFDQRHGQALKRTRNFEERSRDPGKVPASHDTHL